MAKEKQLIFEEWALLDAERSYGRHEGLDFYSQTGDLVLACLDGFVKDAGFSNDGYGNFVYILHDNSWATLYAHLDEITCEIGDFVFQGEQIGTVGSTGNSTGPHLHLTVQNFDFGSDGYWMQKIVDPLLYL